MLTPDTVAVSEDLASTARRGGRTFIWAASISHLRQGWCRSRIACPANVGPRVISRAGLDHWEASALEAARRALSVPANARRSQNRGVRTLQDFPRFADRGFRQTSDPAGL